MKYLNWILLAVAGGAIVGCGGSGDGGSGPVTGDYPVNATVAWPARSRDIAAPGSALSLKIIVSGAGATGGDVTITGNRNGDDNAHTQTFSGNAKVKGSHPFHIDFYAATDGSGDKVATAGGTVNIDGSTTLPSVGFDSTISTVSIPEGQMIKNGSTGTVTAEVKDAEGNLIALSPGSFQWTIATGTDHLTYADGVFTGVSRGRPTLSVAVDGKTSEPATVGVYDILEIRQSFLGDHYQDGDGDTPWLLTMDSPNGGQQAWISNEAGKYAWTRKSLGIYLTLGEETVLDRVEPYQLVEDTSDISLTNLTVGDRFNFPNGSTDATSTTATRNVSFPQGGGVATYNVRSGIPIQGILRRNIGSSEVFDFQGSDVHTLADLSITAPGSNSVYVRLVGNGLLPLGMTAKPDDAYTFKVFPKAALGDAKYSVEAAYGTGLNSNLLELETNTLAPVTFPELSDLFTISNSKVFIGASGGQQVSTDFTCRADASYYIFYASPFSGPSAFSGVVSPKYLGTGEKTFTTPDLVDSLSVSTPVTGLTVSEVTSGVTLMGNLQSGDARVYRVRPDVPGYDNHIKKITRRAAVSLK